MRASVEEVQDEIVRELAACRDGLDRYSFLVDLGKKHPTMDAGLKTEDAAIPGCQSRVWIAVHEEDGELLFTAASDSLIINGILALLLRVYNRRAPHEIAESKPYFLVQSGLLASLSPTRANGIAAIVRKLQECGEYHRHR